MTRHLPPERLQASPPSRRDILDRAVGDIFNASPSWQLHAAMAAVYRLRPQLGVEPDPMLHQMHMWAWPRDAGYFGRVCRLFKLYGIGSEWGEG